jgi:Peptidase family M23
MNRLSRQFYYAVSVFFAGPLLLLWGVWTEPSAATLKFIIFGAVFMFLVLVGRWDIMGYLFRPILPVPFLIICFRKGGWYAPLVATAFVAVTWLLLSRPRVTSFIELSFPLRDGLYVAHGGSPKIINHHALSKSQRYAMDIVRLNPLGFRCSGVYPSNLKAYAILHAVVYSPCEGVITAVVNDQPDLLLGDMDPKHIAGNYVVIRCAGTDALVGLAHLARGSVRVRVGDTVTAGQPLAQVGNSGHTSEPHLHIHAKRGGNSDSMLDGEGVAIRFGQRWLIRNSLVRAVSPNRGPVNKEVQCEAYVDHLRHAKFTGLREDKDARSVTKEHGGEA